MCDTPLIKIRIKRNIKFIIKEDFSLWTKKYVPTNLNSFYCNVHAVYALHSLLKNHDNKKPIILIGNSGTGKTVSAKVISQLCGYNPMIYTGSELRLNNQIKTIVENAKGSINILDMLKNANNKKPTLIIFDEIDLLTTSGIKDLYDILKKKVNLHIICICNKNTDKTIKNIIKLSNCIKFKHVRENELTSLLNHILKQEKMELNKFDISKIISLANGDIRQFLLILHYIKSESNSNVDNLLVNYTKKDKDQHVFYASEKILSSKLNMKEIDYFLGFEKYLIPLLLQENYLDYVDPFDTNYHYISESISNSNIILKCIKSGQNWDLSPAYAITGCHIPTYHINKHPNQIIPLRYTSLLTQNSVRSCKKKVYIKVKEKIHNIDPMSTQYISEIILKEISKDLKYLSNCDNIIEDPPRGLSVRNSTSNIEDLRGMSVRNNFVVGPRDIPLGGMSVRTPLGSDFEGTFRNGVHLLKSYNFDYNDLDNFVKLNKSFNKDYKSITTIKNKKLLKKYWNEV